MTSGRRRRLVLGLLALPVALVSCSSSKAVTDLAAVTGRNTALLEGHLSSFVRQQQAIADIRISTVSRLHRQTVEAEAMVAQRQADERETGLAAPIQLSEQWRQQTEESARQHIARQESLAAARQQLIDKQKAVQVPTAALQDSGKSLVAVSEELSFREHVQFLFNFASEVGADVKKAQDDAKKAKADGDAKVKQAEDAAKQP